MISRQTLHDPASVAEPPPALDRPVVLIGLMGAGKSRVGKRLAERLALPFVDVDHEIEKCTGQSITELFASVGEPAFREGERRTIRRLVSDVPTIIAAGGGAYMDPETRALIRERAISLWLRADLDTLVERTGRSDRRPLLQGVDRRTRLEELMALRHPVYAEADLVVDSLPGSVEHTVDTVIKTLAAHCGRQ